MLTSSRLSLKWTSQPLLFAIGLATGLALVPLAIFGPAWDGMLGDQGDPRLNNYFLEHGYLFFSGKLDHYWDAPFMVPEKNTMAYSDNLWGSLPFYVPYRLLGFDRETAFQLWALTLFVLNYCCAFYALFQLTSRSLYSAGGAYLFTFSLPVIAQLGHPQLLATFMIPLAFLWLIRHLDTGAFRYWVFGLLALAYQFYCGIYLGFLLLLALGLYGAVYGGLVFIQKRGQFNRVDKSIWYWYAGSSVAFFLMLGPLLYPYYQRSRMTGLRSWPEVEKMLPRLNSYFYPAEESSWRFLEPIGNPLPYRWEHRLFVGGVALIAFLLFPLLYYRSAAKNKFVEAAFYTLVALILLTLDVQGYSLYRVIRQLPGFGAMRAVSRIILVDLALFSLVMVYVATHFVPRWISGKVAPYLVLLVIILDQRIPQGRYNTHSKQADQRLVEDLTRQIRAVPRYASYQTFVYLPRYPLKPEIAHITAMLTSQSLLLPTINAYSGGCPPAYQVFWDYPGEAGYERWLQATKLDRRTILVVE